jgi:putative oxidoreductase
MFTRLLKTDSNITLTILRIVVGAIFFAHGAQKMFGWWGGSGFSGTMNYFESSGIPALFAFLAIVAEFFGGIGLLLGFLTRIAAFGIAIVMLVAIATVHWPNGFFMNWAGNQKGEGFEYHLLVLAITVSLMIAGAGAYSIDGLLYRSEAYGHRRPVPVH